MSRGRSGSKSGCAGDLRWVEAAKPIQSLRSKICAAEASFLQRLGPGRFQSDSSKEALPYSPLRLTRRRGLFLPNIAGFSTCFFPIRIVRQSITSRRPGVQFESQAPALSPWCTKASFYLQGRPTIALCAKLAIISGVPPQLPKTKNSSQLHSRDASSAHHVIQHAEASEDRAYSRREPREVCCSSGARLEHSLTLTRAYIAASRRSDRSLEARIESARRASEIHKRRTGRSLRVTEQDVVNEEMYEEEDDDLPMQYRRLTAHMNTNSADFNRRLAAYLTNHVAMRSALDQAISSSYPQQAQNGQQWSPTHNQDQGWPQQAPQLTGGVMAPQMLHRRSNSYHPYAPQQHQTHRSSNSHSPVDMRQPPFSQTAQQQTPRPQQHAQNRRPSAPVNAQKSSHSTISTPYIQPAQRSSSASSFPNLAMSPAPEEEDENAIFSTIPLPPKAMKPSPPVQDNPQYPHWPQSQVASPLTTTLPPETQMFFHSGLPSNGISWYGNDKAQMQPPLSFNQPVYDNNEFHYPFMGGMSQTLAPGALDNMQESMNWPTPTSATDSGYGTDFESMNFNDNFTKPMMPDSMPASGQLTPADNDWSSFINTSSWEENET